MEDRGTFESVRTRLEEIVEAVGAEDVTLDEALALYEEAVKLGLAACDLSEKDVEAAFPEDAPVDAAEDAPTEDAPAGFADAAVEPAAEEAPAPEGAEPAARD
ncbi:exodeoxyribonuclease VII small subunit [Enterorhabdus sp. P55]|jgi:exodeoxyribonuclease VII small subunit|uniref:exodeoxyribonuclease VII small subunit n=1 Tax=Enterorhabdus sp. P55 TaxID=2304571 RepID=UPI00137150B9|nr:exodeoxyribonuclease VII small subunit [Enterorhabdus sp. P55]MCI8451231.1 exodeoxyribonuclease VII small subunit [Eggerthellaceae bacterium]NBI32686.1 exodeoxyribonuclease VII small subunit [Enterorhabdus sp. P55]